MQYKTHLTTTFAVSLPLMVSRNSLAIGAVAALALGNVFPDIDEPHSYIGSRLRGVSDVIGILFDHRGITHSLIGGLIFGATGWLGSSLLGLPIEWIVWFVIGYYMHLIEDSFSKSGVAWLQPFSNQSLQFGFNKFYYKTGSIAEKVILFFATLLLVFQISRINLKEDFIFPNWIDIQGAAAEQVNRIDNFEKPDIEVEIPDINVKQSQNWISERLDNVSNWTSKTVRGWFTNENQ